MKDAQNLMALLFLSRDFAHKAHLNTDSFSQHTALGDFYDEIIDLADSFAEAWMGRNMQKIGAIPTLISKQGDVVEVLQQHLETVQTAREFVAKDSMLSNIVDEIEALYCSTLYKLKFLK